MSPTTMLGDTMTWILIKRAAGLACVVALVAAGCSESTPPQQDSNSANAEQTFPNWPATLNNFRFRWSAAEGIDLTSGPAVPLRAFMESNQLIYKTLSITAAYPGYQRAVPYPPWKLGTNWPSVYKIDNPNDVELRNRDQIEFGNRYYRIMQITPQGNGFRAVVCWFAPARYARTDDGRYELLGPAYHQQPEPDLHAVDFTQRDPRSGPNPPPPPAGPQEGPLPAPVDDVFSNWIFTAVSLSQLTWWYNNGQDSTDIPPEYKPLKQRCAAEMPVPEALHGLQPRILETPPPTEPAFPGWPTRAQ